MMDFADKLHFGLKRKAIEKTEETAGDQETREFKKLAEMISHLTFLRASEIETIELQHRLITQYKVTMKDGVEYYFSGRLRRVN